MGLPSSASVWVARSAKVCLKRVSASAFETYSWPATRGPGVTRRSIADRSSGVAASSRYTDNSAVRLQSRLRRSRFDVVRRKTPSTKRATAMVAVESSPGLPSTPEAGDRFVEGIAERAHQVISTIWPWSRVTALRSTRRISSRSWVATTTVVPRAFVSRNRFMISSDRSGSRLPVGSSARTSCGIVDERARDGDPLLLAAGQLLGQGVHPVLQTDPLEHLEGLSMLNRLRHAEHAHDERDILKDGESRDQSKILKDKPHRSAIALDLPSWSAR